MLREGQEGRNGEKEKEGEKEIEKVHIHISF